MELTATNLPAVHGFLEAVSPVDTEQADHRKLDAHAQTGRPLHIERIELTHLVPSVTTFEEGKGVHRSGRFKHQRVAQLERQTAVSISRVGISTSQTAVLVTTQANRLGGVAGGISRHTIATT